MFTVSRALKTSDPFLAMTTEWWYKYGYSLGSRGLCGMYDFPTPGCRAAWQAGYDQAREERLGDSKKVTVQ